MPERSRPVLLALSLALSAPMTAISANIPSTPALGPGDPLPPIEAPTLTGKTIRIPDAVAGRPFVVLLGFSKEAGYASKEWAASILKDFGNDGLPVFQVPVLEGLPFFLRGMVLSMMRRGTPQEVQGQVLLLYNGKQAWQSRLDHKIDDYLYVMLVGRDSRLMHIQSGPFTADAYRELKPRLETLAQSSTPALAGGSR